MSIPRQNVTTTSAWNGNTKVKRRSSLMRTGSIVCCLTGFVVMSLSFSPIASYGDHGDHDGPYGENDGIHASDETIKAWASQVADFWRPEHINFGTPGLVLGPPRGTYDCFALGDGGWIVAAFDLPIADGPGPDFAVWENGFISRQAGTEGLLFAELMFVEVSTNGENFARLPSVNLIPASPPLGGFGCIDPTYVHNVAGKHPNGNDDRDEGTPFDLHDLINDPLVMEATVDLTDIRFVRLVDVVGDGSTVDSLGNSMWDPYPTPFGAGGADADAVGVLNQRRLNVAPNRPELASPPDEETGVVLSPTLSTAPFFDDDAEAGEYHLKTQWQLSTTVEDFESPLLYETESRFALTALVLPGAALEPDSIYYWRARFADSYGDWSEWSQVFSFTTTDDVDANGIADDQELAPDSPVDLNQDGTPDVDQITDLFKSLNTVAGAGQIGLATEAGTTIKYVASLDPDQFESDADKPDLCLLGLISFTVEVGNPGDEVTLTVYLSESAPEGYDWYKYEPSKGWYLFARADFSADRKSVTLTIQDGGQGDFYDQPDGLVVDPGGVGYTSSPEPSNGSGIASKVGGGTGGCFVSSMLPMFRSPRNFP